MARPKFKELCPTDQQIKSTFRSGMREGLQLTIELRNGFEDFGAYENYANGYYATIPEKEPYEDWSIPDERIGVREIKLEHESLSVLVARLEEALKSLELCSTCGYKYHKRTATHTKCAVCSSKK